MVQDFETLVTRASAGDELAIDELVESHLESLRAFLRLKAGPGLLARESVSDLVQSVCREILEDADQFQHGGLEGFRKWLFTRALRKIAERHRHHLAQKRDVRREQEAPRESAWQAACDAFGTPSQHAIANESQERLDAAFRELSSEQQDIVMMARFLGMSHAEIAEETGKSEVAVRKVLSRALARLATEIDPES